RGPRRSRRRCCSRRRGGGRTRSWRSATPTMDARSGRWTSPGTRAGQPPRSRRSRSRTRSSPTATGARSSSRTRSVASRAPRIFETSSRPPPRADMIAEPIQGVGGFVTPPQEYFQIVKGILDEFGIPFVADEVQTGFGRTGEAFWGIESYGVRPDAIVCAKGLGNGLAIGAVVGREEMVESIEANSISTFGG